MYEQFANLARRIDGMTNDIETAKNVQCESRQRLDGATADLRTAEKEYDTLRAELEAWHVYHDCEIGTYPVPGGQVVVTAGKVIKFIEIDADTQEFAERYAWKCTHIREVNEKMDRLQKSRLMYVTARAQCLNEFYDRLIDGDYTVANGTVTIKNGKVTFERT